MSTLHPERVIAVYYRSGSAFVWTNRPGMYPPVTIPAASYAIPRMCSTGVNEKGLTRILLATYGVYRSKGAPAGFAQDPRTGHECGDSRYFAIPFLDACLAMRLPQPQPEHEFAGGHEQGVAGGISGRRGPAGGCV